MPTDQKTFSGSNHEDVLKFVRQYIPEAKFEIRNSVYYIVIPETKIAVSKNQKVSWDGAAFTQA